ncbi:MAG: GAF domain-containing protein [Deltaproteobacteria bacterium]|nr:GAF domain-containing protein [Deltaproteobacteria bacterium]
MKRETSCINSRAILDYVEERNRGECFELVENLDPEIDSLSDPEGFLRDPNNWVPCRVISRLYQRAKTVLQDDMAAYKIARHAVEKTAMGYPQSIIVKAFWSSRKAIKHAQRINDKWNRNKRVEIVELGRNEAVVRLHWKSGMEVTKDVCLNNQGVYTFMPLVWGGKPLQLEERCCYFEGAPYCEYHLKWPARNRIHELLSRVFTSKSVLMEIIAEMEEDKRVVAQKYEEVNRLNQELNQRIKQLMAIQETGKAILSLMELEELLAVIMNILSNVCEINRAIIMLVNENGTCLEYIHGVDFCGSIPEEIREYRVPLTRVNNILARVTHTGRAEYVPDVKKSDLRKENVLLAYGKPSSIYVVPLITRSEVIGVIATDGVNEKGVPRATRETLEIFAPQIAVAIENARLYRRLQEQMLELERSHGLLIRAEKFSLLGHLSARLAHEIKNPMTAIGAFMQMLPGKYDDEEYRNGFYKVAMEETKRVNNLITELLDLVKTKESHFEWSNLHELIDRMILLVSPQGRAGKVELTRSFDSDIPLVWMDTEKMKQVLLNILTNAIEFTPEKGRIHVMTRYIRRGDNGHRVRIEIADNGIGIPPECVNKVFDPYFTTRHRSTMRQGTGLGLFIAHQNMQEQGGTLDVKSHVNEGTTFVMTLPGGPGVSLSVGRKDIRGEGQAPSSAVPGAER